MSSPSLTCNAYQVRRLEHSPVSLCNHKSTRARSYLRYAHQDSALEDLFISRYHINMRATAYRAYLYACIAYLISFQLLASSFSLRGQTYSLYYIDVTPWRLSQGGHMYE